MSRAKKFDTNAVQLKRIITACTILAIFFLLLIAYEHLQPAVENAKAIQNLNAENGVTSENLPRDFSEEVVAVNDFSASNINVNDTQNVIGFICSGNTEIVSEKIKASMQAKGWVFLDSGTDSIFSAKKSGGKYSYAYIQLTQIGENVSVVFTLS